MGNSQQQHGMPGGRLAALWEYWEARTTAGQLPARRDIDPIDLPRHLPTVMLIDGIGDGASPRYRFRLIGTGLARLLVRDPTTKHLDEVLDESELDALDGVFRHIAGQGVPAALSGRLVWSNGWSVAAEWLFLPLASDGCSVDMILGYAELPSLPVRLPAGRARLEFSWMQPVRQSVLRSSGATLPARGWLPPRGTQGITLAAAS